MRVAIVVVFVSILATASEASTSCMTRTEARRHFGSAHLYWHGADHCWNVTAVRRHHRIHYVREKSTHHVREQADHQDRENTDRQARPKPDHQAEPKIDHPKWHESMSQMLPGDEEPVRPSWVDRWVDIEPAQSSLGARWVDIVHAAQRDDGDHRPDADAGDRRVSDHRHETGRTAVAPALTRSSWPA